MLIMMTMIIIMIEIMLIMLMIIRLLFFLGLSSVTEVESGIQHIIADVIAKDHRTMDLVRQL